jgi:sulfate adenylyltransferase
MSKLVPPHGGKGLVECLLKGDALKAELKKAEGLKALEISNRVKGDLIMLGIGGFSPLSGFMPKADWKSVCENFTLADGTFWPVPGGLDTNDESVKVGDEIALKNGGEIFATMKVTEKYELTDADKKWECEKVYRGSGAESEGDKFWEIAPKDHPGVPRWKPRAGPTSPPCSFATPCTAPTSSWPRSPAKCATAWSSTR